MVTEVWIRFSWPRLKVVTYGGLPAGVAYSALKSGTADGDGVRPGPHASTRRPSGSYFASLTRLLRSVVLTATARPGSSSWTCLCPSEFCSVTVKAWPVAGV